MLFRSDVIAPAFAANNWTGTAFIDGDASVVNAFKGTLKILIDKYGWEPGCQGKGHTDYTTNGRDIGADYDECVANFLAAGLPAPKQFAYPQNKSSAALDKVLAARGVIWRRGNGNPTMQNAGFGCPNLPDNMVRSGWSQLLGTNLGPGTTNSGPAHTQLKNRLAATLFTGGVLHEFTHNAKPFAFDNLGMDLTQFYQWVDMKKEAEFYSGLRNIPCSQTRAAMDAEVFI